MKPLFFLGLGMCFLGGCIIRNEKESWDTGSGGGSAGTYLPCTGGSTSAGTGGTNATGGTDTGTGGVVEPPPPPPECLELADETACTERTDCEPIYAGTDCSCGPDCTCIGGEPGCVCESYGYLVCVDAEDAEA
jgi:hypothetical protein